MTLILKLTPEEEARVEAEARRAGLSAEEYALSRLFGKNAEASLPAVRPGSLVELFSQWQEEDATGDSGELARRDAELQELKANLNANRVATGERPLFQ